MKFLILFAVIVAASAVPYYPYTYGKDFYRPEYYGKEFFKPEYYGKEYYGKEMYPYGYGKDLYTDKYDYKTLMLGGSKLFLDKDISLVKKDFIIYYYKYLVDLLDIFKTRFNDILVDVDFKKFNTLEMPMYCTKMSGKCDLLLLRPVNMISNKSYVSIGLMRWMMMMNIDFTKYDPYYFDMFMWCKITDYMMFMKYYWLNFNYVDVMHKDFGFMKDFYGVLGDKFLYKFGDYYGKYLYGDKMIPEKFMYEDKYIGGKYIPEKFFDYGLFSKYFPTKDYYYRY